MQSREPLRWDLWPMLCLLLGRLSATLLTNTKSTTLASLFLLVNWVSTTINCQVPWNIKRSLQSFVLCDGIIVGVFKRRRWGPCMSLQKKMINWFAKLSRGHTAADTEERMDKSKTNYTCIQRDDSSCRRNREWSSDNTKCWLSHCFPEGSNVLIRHKIARLSPGQAQTARRASL